MQVSLPTTPWPQSSVEPGKLVLTSSSDAGMHYAMTTVWNDGTAGYVLLDGSLAGELDDFTTSRSHPVAGDFTVRISRKLEDWTNELPDGGINVCTDGTKAYFYVVLHGQRFSIDIETGHIEQTKKRFWFVRKWGIYMANADQPFIGTAVV